MLLLIPSFSCKFSKRADAVRNIFVLFNSPLGRPKRRWEGGIRMDLREIRWRGGGLDWIRLAQDRDRWRAVVNAMMNLRVLAPRSWLVGWLVS
jgi:hypothetical protein